MRCSRDKGGRPDQMERYLEEGNGAGSLIYAAVDGPDNLLNDGQVVKTLFRISEKNGIPINLFLSLVVFLDRICRGLLQRDILISIQRLRHN
jgi:hypothetical protein